MLYSETFLTTQRKVIETQKERHKQREKEKEKEGKSDFSLETLTMLALGSLR